MNVPKTSAVSTITHRAATSVYPTFRKAFARIYPTPNTDITRIYSTPSDVAAARTDPTSSSPPYVNNDGSGNDSPSLGLIIAIAMIVVFLIGVSVCLYWHKWRNKRSQRHQTDGTRTSFKRSYRGSRTSRGVDTVRHSTKSTTPLRNSPNEKIKTKPGTKRTNSKVANVNVVPLQSPEVGKYAVYWDQNHWKVCPCPSNMAASRRSTGSRPLSPITEVDSPNKTAESSKMYEVSEQGSDIAPYQITWITPNPAPPPYEQSESIVKHTMPLPPLRITTSTSEHDVDPLQGYEPCQNSPFFPNNNTPTTEHDIDSFFEESKMKYIDDVSSSQTTSCPYSPDISRSNSRRVVDGRSTSLASSYPETSFEPSSRQSERQSGYHNSGLTSMSENSGGNTSLSGNISRFEKQKSDIMDENNNSDAVPDSNLYPATRRLNYTLASSMTSSDNTQYSDHTSMLPNVGSHSYTTGLQSAYGLRSLSESKEQIDIISHEDLSKLVDEMSSIRPNSSSEPTVRVFDASDQSFITAGFQRSFANTPTDAPKSASSTGTNEISFAWDHYPLNEMPLTVRPHPEQPLHVKELDNIYRQTLERSHRKSFQAPVLSQKQFWV